MTKHILILDDDTDFSNLLTNIFPKAKTDYKITPIKEPKQALKLLQNAHVDLIITDHRMPQLSGTEFIKIVKEKKPNIPIIMVSGFLDNETIRQLINIRLDGIFIKPLKVFALLERTSK